MDVKTSDFINSIKYTKTYLWVNPQNDEAIELHFQKQYSVFLVQKALVNFKNIYIVNEINANKGINLNPYNKKMHYDYMFNAIKPNQTYSSAHKSKLKKLQEELHILYKEINGETINDTTGQHSLRVAEPTKGSEYYKWLKMYGIPP